MIKYHIYKSECLEGVKTEYGAFIPQMTGVSLKKLRDTIRYHMGKRPQIYGGYDEGMHILLTLDTDDVRMVESCFRNLLNDICHHNLITTITQQN